VDWWRIGLAAVGLTFTVWGTFEAGRLAVEDHRIYGDQRPLFPELITVRDWLLHTVLRRPRTVRIHAGTAHAVARAGGTLNAQGYAPPAANATVEEQLAAQAEQIRRLYTEVGDLRVSLHKAERRGREHVAEVAAELRARDDALDAKIGGVAAAGVRRELRSLLLVGIGSCVAAIPSLSHSSRRPGDGGADGGGGR